MCDITWLYWRYKSLMHEQRIVIWLVRASLALASGEIGVIDPIPAWLHKTASRRSNSQSNAYTVVTLQSVCIGKGYAEKRKEVKVELGNKEVMGRENKQNTICFRFPSRPTAEGTRMINTHFFSKGQSTGTIVLVLHIYLFILHPEAFSSCILSHLNLFYLFIFLFLYNSSLEEILTKLNQMIIFYFITHSLFEAIKD